MAVEGPCRDSAVAARATTMVEVADDDARLGVPVKLAVTGKDPAAPKESEQLATPAMVVPVQVCESAVMVTVCPSGTGVLAGSSERVALMDTGCAPATVPLGGVRDSDVLTGATEQETWPIWPLVSVPGGQAVSVAEPGLATKKFTSAARHPV